MPNRPHGRARMDPSLGPWAVCDRCSMWYSMADLTWQYDFQGGSTPQKLNLLVCRRTCLDDLAYQNMLLVLPPDPPPQANIRPEFFDVDESNFLTTQSESILTTQSGVDLIQSIPNPSSNANTTYLSSRLAYPGGVVTTLYLDLFQGGAPGSGGTSILLAMTGSATRTDVASSVEATATFAENTSDITVTSSSLAQINVSHVGLYSAASGGTLLVSGAVAASQPTIWQGTAVVFKAPDLYFDLA